MSIKIVTVANKAPEAPYYCFNEMKQSASKFGHEPLIAGWGKEWGGLGQKPKILKAAIESGQIKSEYIVFIDAYDVVLAKAPEEMLEIAGDFNIIFGAERNFWHHDINRRMMDELRPSFKRTEAGFDFLNSGFCLAKTEAMLDLLRHIQADSVPNDHKDGDRVIEPEDGPLYAVAYCESPQHTKIELDNDCKLVCNLHSVKADEVVFGDQIVIKPTRNSPCAFHFNGGSKTDGLMEPILKHLRL